MRKHAFAAALAAAALALSVGLGAAGKGKSKGFIAVDEIKPGMKGHGVTVFSGHDPERFDVEVISVIHAFLPNQDLILARCSHPVLDHAGVLAGMSGSPVYFDGRMAGAVAYAWRFAKDPIAGITPIASMNEYFDLPLMPPGTGSGSKKIMGPSPHPAVPAAPPGQAFWDRFDLQGSQMVPLATPVSGAGPLAGGFLEALSSLLDPHFMVATPSAPAATGKKGQKAKKTSKIKKFRPGDAIAVRLVGGDLDMAGTGTVTDVKGSRALGFGHPMFNWGEVRFPAARAEIHHCLASSAFSFKMSESGAGLGSVVQDRQAGIMADMDVEPHTVDLDIRLRDKTRGLSQDWHMDVAHHNQATANLVRSALTSAVDHFALEVVDTVADGTYRVEVAGHEPLVFDEKVFLASGTLSLSYSQRLSDALYAIMGSSFEEARLDRVAVDLDLEYGHDVAVIAGAYASKDEVQEGDTVKVWVILKPHRGAEMTLGFDLEVPGGTAGQDLRIDLKPGGRVPPDFVPPEDLDDVLANLALGYPDDKVVAVVQVPGAGLTVGGQKIGKLPLSALSTFQPQAAFLGGAPLAILERHLITTPYLLEGDVSINIKVKPK
jgi:hypothetical protein